MVNYNLIEEIGIQEGEVEGLIREALGEEVATGDMDGLLQDNIQDFKPGAILKGRVIGKAGDDVVIDVGLKSEGLVHKSEFDNYSEIQPGDIVEVLLEDLEDTTGTIQISSAKPIASVAGRKS